MKFAKIVFLALFCAVLLVLLDCRMKPRQMPQEYQAPGIPASAGTTEQAGQPVKEVWPPAWDEKKEGLLAVSENLLAKNYLVVLDSSGSMSEHACNADFGVTKLDVAKSALKTFASQVPADANLGFFVFENSLIQERLPLGMNNRPDFIKVADATASHGGTPLYDAVLAGFKALTRQAQKQLGYGEYFLVVVTDGEANPGQEPDRVVDYVVEKTPITIYTVGFCIGSHHTLNRPGVTYYREANNPKELASALQQVLAESPEFKDISSFQQQ